MSDEREEADVKEAAVATAAPKPDPTEVLGAKGRRALLAKLPPLGWQGGQILDAMKLESDGDLANVLELTADDFLDPLWERVHGSGSST
jgi:hypothetical protein